MPVPVFSVNEVLTSSAMNQVGLWRLTSPTVTSAGGTAATASNGVITVGTGNTSVTISNAFSNDYDNYRIIYTGGTASALGQFTIQLNSVTTGYYMSGFGSTYAAGAFIGDYQNNDTRWRTCGVHATAGNVMDIDLYCPFLTMKTFIKTNYTFYSNGYAMAAGECTDANSRTGFTIAPASGTITGGQIRIYGYRK